MQEANLLFCYKGYLEVFRVYKVFLIVYSSALKFQGKGAHCIFLVSPSAPLEPILNVSLNCRQHYRYTETNLSCMFTKPLHFNCAPLEINPNVWFALLVVLKKVMIGHLMI